MSRRITERYRLDKLVRASAAASVFRATDLRSDATVAVKLITEAVGAEAEAQRASFLATVRALQSISHPALPRVLDSGFTSAGNAFLVTDFTYGTSLEVFAGSPAPRVLVLLLQVVDGLEALAAAGVAHGNLRLDNLLVTPGAQGEQVQLLGLGTAALRPGDAAPAAGPEGRRADLHAFARAACALLGIRVPAGAAAARVTLPPTVAGTLHEPEALSALLSRLLREDVPGAPPSYEAVRGALRAALLGTAAARAVASQEAAALDPDETAEVAAQALEDTAAVAPAGPDDTAAVTMVSAAATPAAGGFDDVTTRVVRPAEIAAAAAVPPPLGPPATAATSSPSSPSAPSPAPRSAVQTGRRRRPVWFAAAAVIGPLLLLVLLVAIVALRWGTGGAEGDDHTAAPEAAPGASTPSGTAAPLRSEIAAGVHPQIERAEAQVVAGEGEAAWDILQSIPEAERRRFTAAERERYQRLVDDLGEARLERLARRLALALRAGDGERIRAAADVLQQAAGGQPPSAARRDLARARRAVDVMRRLRTAQSAGDRLETLARAGELAEVLPGSAAAAAAREEAAAALEAEAAAAAENGQLAEARATLEALQRAWPERTGLAERLERLAAESRTGEQLEAALAAATRAEQAGRPLDGLRALAAATPNARFEERFGQARARLRALLERLDRAAPAVALRGAAPADYEKDAPIRLALRVTDDHEVASAELRWRPEGGAYSSLPLARRSPGEYDAEIPSALHQNKAVEWYVVATDHSGHEGRLGGPESPQRVRRKRWWLP